MCHDSMCAFAHFMATYHHMASLILMPLAVLCAHGFGYDKSKGSPEALA